MHENRETWASTGRDERTSPAGKGRSRTACTNDVEESDRSVVPVSQPNKAEPSAAEVGEGRGRTKENTAQSHTLSTQGEAGVSQGLRGARKAESNRRKRSEGKPETFDFLGFTHYCGFKKGRFIVWRKTAGKRMRAKLQQLKQELRRRMHEPLAQVGEWLGSVNAATTNTMRCRETARRSGGSGTGSSGCGGK